MIVHTNVGSAIRDLAPRRRTQRKALRRALIRTYNICGEAFYPRWRAFFLDRAFQAQGAGPLLACYLEKRACQTPDELVLGRSGIDALVERSNEAAPRR